VNKSLKRYLLGVSAITFLIIALSIYANIGIDILWRSMANPPEPVSEIIGIEIVSNPGGIFYQGADTAVYVQTTTGNKYYWADDGTDVWKRTYRNGSNEDIFLECNQENAQMRDSKNRVLIWCTEWDSGSVRYIIRPDGTMAYKKNFSRVAGVFFYLMYSCWVPILLALSGLAVYGVWDEIRDSVIHRNARSGSS